MYKYKKIKLSDGSTRDEHRLVMEKYLGRILSRKECVHHKDGNPRNNDISNLEVMDRSEHSRLHFKPHLQTDSTRKLLSELRRGENHSQAKLSDDLVRYIRKRLKGKIKACTLAKELGLSASIVGKVKRYKRWAHVV